MICKGLYDYFSTKKSINFVPWTPRLLCPCQQFTLTSPTPLPHAITRAQDFMPTSVILQRVPRQLCSKDTKKERKKKKHSKLWGSSCPERVLYSPYGGIHTWACLLGCIFRNFGILMGGFSPQTKVSKFHILGVFWKKCAKTHPIGTQLGDF